MAEEQDKKMKVVFTEQALNDLAKIADRCAEEDEADEIELRERFLKFMEGAEEVVVFGDSCFEWENDFSKAKEIVKAYWMDVYFSRGRGYVSPICINTKKFHEEEGWDEDDGEWGNESDVVIDVEYLTKENILGGVKLWLEKYHPHLAGLPIRYEDEEIVEQKTDEMFAPIKEIMDRIESGEEKVYPIEEVMKELETRDEKDDEEED
jgi:hypothetical protein